MVATPRYNSRPGGKKAMNMSYGADQDEELADLHRRFSVLEEEARAGQDAAKQQGSKYRDRDHGDTEHTQETNAAELKRLDDQICELRGRHDRLAHANLDKRRELDRLADRLRDLSKESKRPTSHDNPIIKEIRALEARLEKAVAKYEDAHEVRRTYEAIVKRLKEERIGFDNQLQASEAALKAKEQDYEELLLMSHDANHSKEVAKQELGKFESIVSEEKKMRDKELTDRRTMVQNKLQINQDLEKREKERREALKEPQSDAGDEGSHAQKMKPGSQHTISEEDIEEEQEKIAAYEAAFREIKEATGVSDVNEVIQKFITQEETHKNLVSMTKESQTKIDQLLDSKNKSAKRVQELKYSANAEGAGNTQQSADKLQNNMSEHQARYERQRHKYERMAKILISVKAGVQHLAEKLEGLQLETAVVPLTDDTLVEVLLQCEEKLRRVTDAIRQEEDALEQEGDAPETLAMQAKMGDMSLEPAVANNCRIKDPTSVEEAQSEEEFEEDLEEDVVDRDSLKKQSSSILDKAAKKTKKRRNRKAP